MQHNYLFFSNLPSNLIVQVQQTQAIDPNSHSHVGDRTEVEFQFLEVHHLLPLLKLCHHILSYQEIGMVSMCYSREHPMSIVKGLLDKLGNVQSSNLQLQ